MQCLTLFLFYFKLEDNYYVVLVSAIHQHESATGIHMSLLSWTSLPPTSHLSYPSRLSSWLSVLPFICVCFLATLPIHPTLSFPFPICLCVYTVHLPYYSSVDGHFASVSQLVDIKTQTSFF